MVSFSCDGCAEVLKKSQVDGHASRCRRCESVSCADCLVSFYGDDYRAHTSCLTEVERYEKKNQSNNNKRQKQTPQEAWMELLADAVTQAPTHLRQHLSEISTRDNVPRKEKAFRNFMANSMKISKSSVDQIWNYLKELREKQQQEAAAAKEQQAKKTPDVNSSEVPKSNSESKGEVSPKEQKNTGEKEPAPSSQSSTNGNKDSSTVGLSDEKLPNADEVKKAMKKILKKEKSKAMPVKNLRKAVCAMYGVEKKGKKHMKSILKEHLSGKKFIVDGKIVRLKVD